jgi:hypothetical protein
MASKVDIANFALAKLGDGTILSLTDSNERARAVNLIWDMVEGHELRSRVWHFTVKRASLAASASVPEWGYDFQYPLPADFVRLLQVDDLFPAPDMSDYRNTDAAVYRIEGGSILTDAAAPLKIKYVARITDTGLWDASFVNVMASRLALELCQRLSNDGAQIPLRQQDYKQALMDAMRANAFEKAPEALPDSSWVLSRL